MLSSQSSHSLSDPDHVGVSGETLTEVVVSIVEVVPSTGPTGKEVVVAVNVQSSHSDETSADAVVDSVVTGSTGIYEALVEVTSQSNHSEPYVEIVSDVAVVSVVTGSTGIYDALVDVSSQSNHSDPDTV